MTKTEKETLATIRNAYGPILTFFKLWDDVVNNTTLTPEQRQDIYTMIVREEGNASESAVKVAELLKSFG